MIDPVTFLSNDRGAVSAHQLILGAAALCLLGMTAYEFFDAGLGSLVSIIDPGVATFAAEMETAASRYANE